MPYFHFTYKDNEVILTPEIITDIKKQLSTQVKEISFLELIKTFKAVDVSPKQMVKFFKKIKEELTENDE